MGKVLLHIYIAAGSWVAGGFYRNTDIRRLSPPPVAEIVLCNIPQLDRDSYRHHSKNVKARKQSDCNHSCAFWGI